MSSAANEADTHADLSAAARAVIRAEEGDLRCARAAVGAVRAEVDRIAKAACSEAESPRMLPTVLAALGHAGLESLVPENASLESVRAALARLHGHLAAIEVASVPRE